MALNNTILQIRDGWPAYRSLRRVSKTESVYKLVTETLPDDLTPLLLPGPSYEFEGSTGRGNITSAPWIATFDKRVTDTATEGFYVVYLFSVDLKRLYLSLAFGTTQFENYFGAHEVPQKLMQATENLRQLVKPKRQMQVNQLDLAATSKDRLHSDYEYSSIFAIMYDLDSLPGEEVLATDYKYMLELYLELVDNPLLPSMEQLLEAEISAPVLVLPPVVKDFVRRAPKSKKIRDGERSSKRISGESKKVGDRGEQIVYDHELAELQHRGLPPSGVIWHARDGESPGWDISSIDENNEVIHIEVKASVGSVVSSLIMTANEWRAAVEHREKYRIYLVTDVFESQPTMEKIRNPAKLVEERALTLDLASVLVGLTPDEISNAGTEPLEPARALVSISDK